MITRKVNGGVICRDKRANLIEAWDWERNIDVREGETLIIHA